MSSMHEITYQRLLELKLVGLSIEQASAQVDAAGGRLDVLEPGQRAVAASIMINVITAKVDDSGKITQVSGSGQSAVAPLNFPWRW